MDLAEEAVIRFESWSMVGPWYWSTSAAMLTYVVLSDALQQSPKPIYLVSEGGTQSNHVRQVAAAGAKLGFKTTLLIEHRVAERYAGSNQILSTNYKEQGNVQLTDLMSAVRVDDTGESAQKPIDDKLGYWIPSGASTHPLGGLGYARWAFEIMEKEEQSGTFFDSVVVATMSGSTLAGMVAGFKLAEQLAHQAGKTHRKRRLIGVAAGPKPKEVFDDLISGIVKTTGSRIGLTVDCIPDVDFEVDSRWHAGAYGRLDERTKERVKLAASMEGLVTDPVYSGKAMAGLCEMVQAGELTGNILFVHTGGVLSLSAYPDLR